LSLVLQALFKIRKVKCPRAYIVLKSWLRNATSGKGRDVAEK